jgi:hypothetical protein
LPRATNRLTSRCTGCGDPSSSRKSPGRTNTSITLERGVTHDKEFDRANKVWNFGSGLKAEVSLKDFRKNVILEMATKLVSL